MIDLLTALCLVAGAGFAFVAALGVVRMPDVFMRMHAATKAGTLGASLILLGAALHVDGIGVTSRVVATILFLLLTAPVAGHVIGRAAYFRGTPLWKHTRADALTAGFRANGAAHEAASGQGASGQGASGQGASGQGASGHGASGQGASGHGASGHGAAASSGAPLGSSRPSTSSPSA